MLRLNLLKYLVISFSTMGILKPRVNAFITFFRNDGARPLVGLKEVYALENKMGKPISRSEIQGKELRLAI